MITAKKELIDVPISDLIPYERNPRKNDKAVKKVAASLKQFGLVKNSVVVDEDMVLITGHTTLKAMQALKWATAPEVTQVFGLTEAQKKAYRIADNRLGEVAEWDLDLLAGELASLNDVGFDVVLTGFEGLISLDTIDRGENADRSGASPWERMQGAAMEKTPKSAAEVLEEVGAAADELFLAICKAFYINRACDVLEGYIGKARAKIRGPDRKAP